MTIPAITGSISSGTLRPQDLAPAFLSALEALDPMIVGTDDHENWKREVAHVVISDGYAADAGEILADLEDAINAVLPAGYYFGANEGDGADFMIMRADDDDL